MQKLQIAAGDYEGVYHSALEALSSSDVVNRIWSRDHTVWRDDPTEISNRLGWLDIADRMQAEVERLTTFAKGLEDEGYTNAVVLGMGGSSLAPEVFSYAFDEPYGIALDILDSTDPVMVRMLDDVLNLEKTLFIVATKSGTTAETLSGFNYFYNRVLALVGGDAAAAGQHFIGITDPGSKLLDLGNKFQFRDMFVNDPNIGGRYSALSFFGLVPAALVGVNLTELLSRAQKMAQNNALDSARGNYAMHLGALMGGLANESVDKLTLFVSPIMANFGDWIEQLVAESTGKDGKGILPVVGEMIASPDIYGSDRLFVHIKAGDDDTYDAAVQDLKEAGRPVVSIRVGGKYDLGGQFFLWEMATAIAGHLLDIQPFDQPNVESAKILARAKINDYMSTGKLEELPVALESDGIQVMGDSIEASTAEEAINNFVNQGQPGGYVSVHAYVPMTEITMDILAHLQSSIRDATGMATTIGFGPRFLHSTGQLHKGDSGNGLFIQFTADDPDDVPIPDDPGADTSGMSFGTLQAAQALGDRAALLEAGRRVIRFHLSDIEENLRVLVDSI